MTHGQDPAVDTATGQVRVFVSYRREDTKHVAGRLRDRIVARLGEESVFVDVEAIEPGLDYVEAIDRAVGSCDVMLVLIGDRWLDASDAQGAPRLDDPTDRLRLEVEAGLRKRTRVIPVLVDTASMPKSSELPAALVPLSRHHATRLRHESFQSDADHLLAVVERVVTGTERPHSAVKRDMVRWWSVGALVVVLFALLALRSGVEESVTDSRFPSSPDGSWGSLVWMLPAMPVLVAALLVASSRRVGVAVGCVSGSALWVAVSLLFVVDKQQDDATAAHLLVLVLLIISMSSLVVAAQEIRQRVTANRGDRVILAGLLMVAAVLARLQSEQIASVVTSTTTGATNWADELGRPRFWVAVLVPVLVCLPAALVSCSRIQIQALVTFAALQIFYPAALSAMRFLIAAGSPAPVDAARDVIFLAGSVLMLLAVLVGQRRRNAQSRSSPAPRT